MQVIVEVPDRFVDKLIPQGTDAARVLLEEAVACAYRERRLTVEQLRQIFDFGTLIQVDAFLQQHAICDYTVEDLASDMNVLDRLFPA